MSATYGWPHTRATRIQGTTKGTPMSGDDDLSSRAAHKKRFGTYGVWGGFAQFSADEVARFERLGLGTVWLGGSPAHLRPVRKVLQATENITVATGIVTSGTPTPR